MRAFLFLLLLFPLIELAVLIQVGSAIGLLPTPEEVEAFEKDPSPTAYEKLVDRLLDSPHYGEQQARHWMDLARYADTKGYVFTEDRNYPFAFTYRDWLIRSLNAVPLQQGKGDLGAMKQSIRLLQEGWLLNIFPEGSRTPDGKLLLLASWRDAATAGQWRPKKVTGLRHRQVRIIRDYGMFDRREAPQFYPPARRSASEQAA